MALNTFPWEKLRNSGDRYFNQMPMYTAYNDFLHLILKIIDLVFQLDLLWNVDFRCCVIDEAHHAWLQHYIFYNGVNKRLTKDTNYPSVPFRSDGRGAAVGLLHSSHFDTSEQGRHRKTDQMNYGPILLCVSQPACTPPPKWNGTIINVINYISVYPAMTCQKWLLWKRPIVHVDSLNRFLINFIH